MNVEFEEQNNILYVILSGELDHHNYNEQKGRIEMKLSTNRKVKIFFDLTGLSFMDSSGISMLYNAYKIAGEFGQTVSAITENEKFLRILQLSGMEKFIKIVSGKECFR